MLYYNHPSNCQVVQIKKKSFEIQKLKREEWILVYPCETVAVQTCSSIKENIPSQGTYVVKLIPSCTISVEKFVLRSYHESKAKVQSIQLPKLTFDVDINPSHIDIQPLELCPINLENFKDIHNMIAIHKKNLETPLEGPIHLRGTRLWTIILYPIFFSLLAFKPATCVIKL